MVLFRRMSKLKEIGGRKLLDSKFHHFKSGLYSMSRWKSFFPHQKFFTHVFQVCFPWSFSWFKRRMTIYMRYKTITFDLQELPVWCVTPSETTKYIPMVPLRRMDRLNKISGKKLLDPKLHHFNGNLYADGNVFSLNWKFFPPPKVFYPRFSSLFSLVI